MMQPVRFTDLNAQRWPVESAADALKAVEAVCEDREQHELIVNALANIDGDKKKQCSLWQCVKPLMKANLVAFDMITWQQNDLEIEVAIVLPLEVANSDLLISLSSTTISARVKFCPAPTLVGRPFAAIVRDDSHWIVERTGRDTLLLKLILFKASPNWWPRLFATDPAPFPARDIPCSDQLEPHHAFRLASELELANGDPEQVFKYYLAAADGRHGASASRVGNWYIDGDARARVPKSVKLALQYLLIGAEEGVHECMYQVGHAFQHGIASEGKDFEKAKFWFTMAADGANHARAMFQLGLLYHRFEGRVEDLAEAARWWARSAALGIPDAMFDLGILYMHGSGVPLDRIKAHELLSKAIALQSSFGELLMPNGIDLDELAAECELIKQEQVEARKQRKKERRRLARAQSPTATSTLMLSGLGVALVAGAVVMSWKRFGGSFTFPRRSTN